jgi:hypothetical protein
MTRCPIERRAIRCLRYPSFLAVNPGQPRIRQSATPIRGCPGSPALLRVREGSLNVNATTTGQFDGIVLLADDSTVDALFANGFEP